MSFFYYLYDNLNYCINIFLYKDMLQVNQYTLVKKLGEGSYGVTYLAHDTAKNMHVAIKTINISKVDNVRSLTDEINILQVVSPGDNCDPYISCYYENFTRVWRGTETMFIVMEYIEGMDLRVYLNSHANISAKLLWSIFYGLAKGLSHIHSKNIAHRDIKPENIMITKDGNIKFIDFGMSCVSTCITSGCINICTGSRVGTPQYIPPEYIKENLINGMTKLDAAQAGDIWSLGVTMFELANGNYHYPYVYAKLSDIYNIADAPTITSNYPQDQNINDTVDAVLQNNPKLRLTAQWLIVHIGNMILSKHLFST